MKLGINEDQREGVPNARGRVEGSGNAVDAGDKLRRSIGLPDQQFDATLKDLHRRALNAGATPNSIDPNTAKRLELCIATHVIINGPHSGETVEVVGWVKYSEGKRGTQFDRMLPSWQAIATQMESRASIVQCRRTNAAKEGELVEMNIADLKPL